ncbi:MAG: hypothetical protein J6M60_07520 [Clostridia bacterium]|nr:hypothetical protein [Clostridia bacterium]
MNVEKVIAAVVSERTGLDIGEDHVHVSECRSYYTQSAEPGCAYILHHYRGVFFVEINKEDWAKLEAEELSVEKFVDTTRWFYGYYWGGGSMCSGGFYTALEKEPGIHNKELIQRVMKITAKVGWHYSCGAKLTDEEITEWNEISKKYLHDPREDYFNEINSYVKEFGYECHGFVCGSGLPDNKVCLLPNSFERTFEVMVGENIIRKLLYGDAEIPNVSTCNFIVRPGHYRSEKVSVTSASEFQKALEDLEIIKEWENFETRVKQNEERRKAVLHSETQKKGFFKKLKDFVTAS